jgi:hypothetical protein
MDLVIVVKDGQEATVDRNFKETFEAFLANGWVLKSDKFEVEFEYDKSGNIKRATSVKAVGESLVQPPVLKVKDEPVVEEVQAPTPKTRSNRIPKD